MTWLCFFAFCIALSFVVLLFFLWQLVKGPSLSDVLDHYRSSNSWHERVAVVFLAWTKKGFTAMLVATVPAIFGCLASICGGLDAESLKVIRAIILDILNFIERRLK
jgi:hypothetical protein